MNRRTLWGMLAIGALSLAACDDPITPEPRSVRSTLASSAQRDDRKGGDGLGGVFTSSNASSGNVVFAFARHADGTLTKAGEFPAGGDGIGGGGDPQQSENTVVLGRDRRRLYVVNAGSNSVTTFAVSPNATLQSLATVSSGGEGPISLASTGNHLFVLNSDNSSVELTLGADGVIAWDGKRLHSCAAYHVPVVDTTGAGDVFHAGFIYGLLQDWPLDRQLEFACAAAALNCTCSGARGGIGNVEAIEELMASTPRYTVAPAAD